MNCIMIIIILIRKCLRSRGHQSTSQSELQYWHNNILTIPLRAVKAVALPHTTAIPTSNTMLNMTIRMIAHTGMLRPAQENTKTSKLNVSHYTNK